ARDDYANVGAGRVGLVSQPCRPRFPDVALVAYGWFPHRPPADRLERDDDHHPAGNCLADAPGSGGAVSHWLGVTVGAGAALSAELGADDPGRSLSQRRKLFRG